MVEVEDFETNDASCFLLREPTATLSPHRGSVSKEFLSRMTWPQSFNTTHFRFIVQTITITDFGDSLGGRLMTRRKKTKRKKERKEIQPSRWPHGVEHACGCVPFHRPGRVWCQSRVVVIVCGRTFWEEGQAKEIKDEQVNANKQSNKQNQWTVKLICLFFFFLNAVEL